MQRAAPPLGSELLIHCSNAAVLAPVYYYGLPVWQQLFGKPCGLESLSNALQMRTGPLCVLLRTARIVFVEREPDARDRVLDGWGR
jgi:hypothetical protein